MPTQVRYSARSDKQGAALIVGCEAYQIPLLSHVGLVSCLNADWPFAVKYYMTAELLLQTADPKWQLIATRFLKGAGLPKSFSPVRGFAQGRARGLSNGEAKPDASVGTGQWMIDTMLASMAIDWSTGQFLPASLGDEKVARILGFREHDLPPLRRAGVLECLNPELSRATKLHSREYILGLVMDKEWLARATTTVNQHWKDKNSRKTK